MWPFPKNKKPTVRALLEQILKGLATIMSAISDYAARVDAAFTAIGADVDGLVTSLDGVTKDVADLKSLIEQLQNNPGPITPEDQALLDQSEAKLAALGARVASVKTALATLDASTETPPAAPNV